MSIRGYSFVFALMKCSYAAFGEQNKTDNDSKCQQVYKSLNNRSIVSMKHTPDFITQLNENEVFVFGSNLRGLHGGGAARIAFEKFGAEWGVGVGPTGQCYAIPTMHGGVDEIAPYVNDFVAYAKQHSDQHFYVTRIGCGIAGFTDEQMAPLFKDLLGLDNVSIPKQWEEILQGA